MVPPRFFLGATAVSRRFHNESISNACRLWNLTCFHACGLKSRSRRRRMWTSSACSLAARRRLSCCHVGRKLSSDHGTRIAFRVIYFLLFCEVLFACCFGISNKKKVNPSGLDPPRAHLCSRNGDAVWKRALDARTDVPHLADALVFIQTPSEKADALGPAVRPNIN